MKTMIGLTARTAALVLLLIMTPPVAVHASSDSATVSLFDFLAATDQAPAVQEARLELESARRQAAAAGYRGDLSFGLNPSVKNVWPTNDDAVYQEIGASVDARIPLGLSDADSKRLEAALDRVKTAEALLAAAYLEAASTTVSAYAEFLQRHEELSVLSAERRAARIKFEAEEAGLESGRTSLVDALRIRRDLDNAERAYSRGETDRDLAYIELLLESVIAESEDFRLMLRAPHPESALGESLEFSVPHPDDAIAALDASHPRIATATASLDAAMREAQPARSPLLSSVRLSASSADGHSGAVTASIPAPSLSLSYRPPSFTVPADAEARSDGSRKHSLTLSAVFSLYAGADRALTADTAQAQIDLRSAALAAAYQSVEASIISAYRRVESAEANINLYQNAVERAEIVYSALELRREFGTAAPGEIETAFAALERAQFEYSIARFALFDERVRYLAAANLPEALPQHIFDPVFGGTQ